MTTEANAPVPTPPDILHCPHCLEPLDVSAHFCMHCGMPLTVYSTIAPLEQVWALGWMINRLLTGRPRAIAVIGTWLVALPALLAIPFIGANTIGFAGPVQWLNLVAGIPPILFCLLYVFLAVRVTVSYLRRG